MALTRRQTITILFAAAGALLAAAILLPAGLWTCAWYADPPAALGEVTLSASEVHVGDTVIATIPVKVPWHRRPAGPLRFIPPDGLQALDTAEARRTATRFGTIVWTYTLRLQPYDLKTFDPAPFTVPLRPDRAGEDRELNGTIPAITVTPRFDAENRPDPTTAGELTEAILPRTDRRWLWTAIAIAVAAVAIILLLRPTRSSRVPLPPPSPWTAAESALATLETDLPMAPDAFFVRLTDIVRRYLEAAFGLHATERTTPEFLREMNHAPDRLSTEQRLLLTDFLTAADMVKFARTEATQEQMLDALTRARRFVVDTSTARTEEGTAGSEPSEADRA